LAPTSPTRPRAQQCGALLPPEHLSKSCDPCWERIARAIGVEPFTLNSLAE
jgi:hypothetical protein